MHKLQRLLLPIALLSAGFASVAIADAIQCDGAAGCEVRIWNPTTQTWGPIESVPRGTIVDTTYAIGWGAGWRSVP